MENNGFDGKIIHIYNSKIIRLLKKIGYLVVIFFIAIYLLTGIYLVGPNEVGMVKLFGEFVRQVPPGIHYHLPYPFESIIKPKITEVRRVEIGFRTLSTDPVPRYQFIPEESLMLTGDENIVDCQYTVQYRINDPYLYLFRVKDVDSAVKKAAESALREIVGKKEIDEVLTSGKSEIQEETRVLIQSILDRYEAGVQIIAVQLQDVQPPTAVVSAFKDVASAREDKVRFVNEAEGYRSEVIPNARGQAEQIIKEAEAWREKVVKEAEGDTARFLQVLREYSLNKEVTRTRLYLETIQKALPLVQKYLIDSSTASQDILKLLPLTGKDGSTGVF
ncbi:MAG: FtsH protease activity modulator HflK [Candidatus Atribacteria bacterium]|nr:FtsH protease activity modulator HflK [Candidatus Atribacteria bacterium]